MKKLNLGCGNDIKESNEKEEWINLDFIRTENVDVEWDLNNFPYPFKDNEFNLIHASHIIEHLENYPKVMKELYRILKVNGKLNIIVPHFSSVNARTPFHKVFFNTIAFKYIVDGFKIKSSEYQPLFYNSKQRIKFHRGFLLWNYIIEPLVNISYYTQRFYETCLAGIFPAHRIEIELKK